MISKRPWLRLLLITVALFFFSSVGFAVDKAPAKAAPATKETMAKPEVKKVEAKVELIDINTATKDQLKALEGIGDAYSQKIIDGRPYAKKDQLTSKKIVPEATYDTIKDKIVAVQAPKKK